MCILRGGLAHFERPGVASVQPHDGLERVKELVTSALFYRVSCYWVVEVNEHTRR